MSLNDATLSLPSPDMGLSLRLALGAQSFEFNKMQNIQYSIFSELPILAQINGSHIQMQLFICVSMRTCPVSCIEPHIIAIFLVLWL